MKSRRLDSRQHEAVYGTAAFLHRATPAKSRSAQSRTVLSGFGDRLLSQEHTPVQGIRGKSNPLPRRSRRRMPSRYTTDTINQPVEKGVWNPQGLRKNRSFILPARFQTPFSTAVVPAGFEPAL